MEHNYFSNEEIKQYMNELATWGESKGLDPQKFCALMILASQLFKDSLGEFIAAKNKYDAMENNKELS